MYPETDVSPITVPTDLINRIKAHLPERLDDRMRRYRHEFLLNEELARQIAWSENNQLFEQVMRLSGGLNGSHSRDEVKDSATFAYERLKERSQS